MAYQTDTFTVATQEAKIEGLSNALDDAAPQLLLSNAALHSISAELLAHLQENGWELVRK